MRLVLGRFFFIERWRFLFYVSINGMFVVFILVRRVFLVFYLRGGFVGRGVCRDMVGELFFFGVGGIEVVVLS